jgi:hypothetical protein
MTNMEAAAWTAAFLGWASAGVFYLAFTDMRNQYDVLARWFYQKEKP